jgi:hypothetical protein
MGIVMGGNLITVFFNNVAWKIHATSQKVEEHMQEKCRLVIQNITANDYFPSEAMLLQASYLYNETYP